MSLTIKSGRPKAVLISVNVVLVVKIKTLELSLLVVTPGGTEASNVVLSAASKYSIVLVFELETQL